MNDTRKFGALTSSIDPTQVATRVKGAILAGSSIIIFLAAALFHLTLSANDIITLATEVGAVSGAVMTLYGAGMWVIAKIYKQPTA